MLVGAILVGAVFTMLLIIFLKYLWDHRHVIYVAKMLPCPKGVPIIGNTLLFAGSYNAMMKALIKLTNQYKEVFCLWIGPVPVFVVVRPEDLQIVLNSSSTLEKDDFYSFLKPYLGNGLVGGPVHLWKKYRRLISPIFHPSNIENHLPVFNYVSRVLTDKIGRELELDPHDELFTAFIDSSMKTFIFDKNFSLKDEVQKSVQFLLEEVGQIIQTRTYRIWLYVDFLFKLLYWKDHKLSLNAITSCESFFNEQLDEYANKRKRLNMNCSETCEPEKSLAYLSYVNPEDGTEDHTWWDELATLTAAASDTGVSAVKFFLLTIAALPKIQTKVRNEILEVMGDTERDVTAKDISSLTYLTQALMESMRFHGVVHLIARRATRDIKLEKVTLPARSRIFILLHTMGWDPDVFPEPHVFRPERFSPENMRGQHKYSFLPFSAGPRNCLGKVYAMFLMKTIIVHILRKFEVRTDIRLEDIKYESKLVLHSIDPVKLEFVPISKMH